MKKINLETPVAKKTNLELIDTLVSIALKGATTSNDMFYLFRVEEELKMRYIK